jgi:hypothetical protein
MGEIEFGKCPYCNREMPLQRKYFYYNINSECHSSQHFEIVWHCKDCTPKEPKETRVTFKTEKIK